MPTSPLIQPRRALGVLFVTPFIASLFIAWWLIGDVSEPGAYQQILSLTVGKTASAVVGGVGVALAVAMAGAFLAIRRREPVRRPAIGLARSAVALGVLLGFALRILSSKTDGANISGGLLILYDPVVAAAILFYAYRRWRSLLRRSRSAGDSSA